jgi:hypothetical protein
MMIESICITIRKPLPDRKDTQLLCSSQCNWLKRCRVRRWSSVRCGTHSCLFYLMFWLVWTTDIRLLQFGSNENSERTNYNVSESIGPNRYLSTASYCLASEVTEDTEHVKSSRKVKTTAVSRKPALTLVLPSTSGSATPVISPSAKSPKEKLSLNQILFRAGKRGLGGGIPGAIAGGFQVLSLMWLRTIINYQCRYGTTFLQALRTLLNDGGIARLYCGILTCESLVYEGLGARSDYCCRKYRCRLLENATYAYVRSALFLFLCAYVISVCVSCLLQPSIPPRQCYKLTPLKDSVV